jgi:CBS domain-containing protein
MRPISVFIGSRDLVTRSRALMRQHGLSTLPVIDGGRLEGVVTQRDIMRVTSTRSNIPVSGVMSPLRALITPATDLSATAVQMADFGLDVLPVVQSPTDRTVVGVVRIEDLLRRLVSELSSQPPVSRAMSRNIISCDEDDEITMVWEIMERSRHSGLPVVRYDRSKHIKKVVGMITRSDIIRSGIVRTSEESKKGKKPPKVKSVMRTPVIIIHPDAPLGEAIELMLRKSVRRLPVVDRGNLVGIISREDVIRTLCR